MIWQMEMDSPLGVVEISANETEITRIIFLEKMRAAKYDHVDFPAVLRQCAEELAAYFAGKWGNFTLAIEPTGTAFQKRVWQALGNIPYGEVRTYQDIAEILGNEKAARAVGAANGKNQLNIIIPCHRLVGSSGKLTGYGGGIWRKEWLLAHEGKHKEVLYAEK